MKLEVAFTSLLIPTCLLVCVCVCTRAGRFRHRNWLQFELSDPESKQTVEALKPTPPPVCRKLTVVSFKQQDFSKSPNQDVTADFTSVRLLLFSKRCPPRKAMWHFCFLFIYLFFLEVADARRRSERVERRLPTALSTACRAASQQAVMD